MQDELDPLCVWVVTDSDATGDDERRCGRQARWEYSKKVTPPGKLAHVERYTMCGKHASEANRAKATTLGYTVRGIE